MAVPVRMLDHNGLPRYSALRAELHEVRKSNARIRWEVRELQKTVEQLKRDPKAVESIARDELGMLREGEIVFQFSR